MLTFGEAEPRETEPLARKWLLLAAAIYALGAMWRFHHIFHVHPPQGFIYDDMNEYLSLGKRMLDPGFRGTFIDSLFPPGMPYLMSWLYKFDPSLRLGQAVFFVLSALTPLLVYDLGRRMFGRRAGLWALALASLYFPFIDLSAYFLSETPFTFLVCVSFCALVRALKCGTLPQRMGWGLASGLAIGLAAAFRPVVLPAGLLAALYIGWCARRQRWRPLWQVFAAGALGLCAVLAPLAVRCTALNEGRFHLVSSNSASNVLMGHCGRVATIQFSDAEHGFSWVAGSPAAGQHGYTGQIDTPAGIYDGRAVMDLAWTWIRNHPGEALVLSVNHVFDLFTDNVPWPPSHSPTLHLARLFEQLYMVFILFPVCMHLYARRRELWRQTGVFAETLVLLPVAGAMITAFISNAEARHRIPFDVFMLLLAGHIYAQNGAAALAQAGRLGESALKACSRILMGGRSETLDDSTRRWQHAAVIVFAAGVVWRCYHVLVLHRPQDYIYQDMAVYTNTAREILKESYRPCIFDTNQPLGTMYYYAALYWLDSSWRAAQCAQLLLSALLPWQIGLIGRDMFGRKIGAASLMLASVYLPFIDLAGYFVTETPFLFLNALSFWLMVRSLKSVSGAPRLALALSSGVALGLAASFRPVILPSAFMVFCYLAWMARRCPRAKIKRVLACSVLGALLILAPLAARMTRLNEGRFCAISTNGASSFLFGHYGRIGAMQFSDDRRGHYWLVRPPAAGYHGFTRQADVPYGIYETEPLKKLAWDWIGEHPAEALVLSAGHVFDLFTGNIPWPAVESPTRNLSRFYEELYALFVIFPVWLYLGPRWRSLLRLRPEWAGEMLLLLPLLGVMIAVFWTLGEARYRIPCDCFMLILAARVYLRPSGAAAEKLSPASTPEHDGSRALLSCAQ